jgi:hypothetical protein
LLTQPVYSSNNLHIPLPKNLLPLRLFLIG